MMAAGAILAWLTAATSLTESFVEQSEAGAQHIAGQGVSDERLAALRDRNKTSMARLRAALKDQAENPNGNQT